MRVESVAFLATVTAHLLFLLIGSLCLFQGGLAASLRTANLAELRNSEKRIKRQYSEDYLFDWNYGNWTTCSSTCGHGLMHRPIHCMAAVVADSEVSIESVYFNWSSIVWQVVPDERCAELSRPSPNGQTRVCNPGPCTRLRANLGLAVWLKGHWMPCNASCGGGHQHRPVYCYQRGRRVSDTLCEMTASKPNEYRRCSARPCTSHWVTGPWTTCSNSCGWGIHHRAIICAPVGNTKPSGQRLTVSWGTGCAPEKQPMRTQLCNSDRNCPTTNPSEISSASSSLSASQSSEQSAQRERRS